RVERGGAQAATSGSGRTVAGAGGIPGGTECPWAASRSRRWRPSPRSRTICTASCTGVAMPETISEARTRLPAHVRRFREQGLDAEPVILGDRRHPDAALLPYETFKLLLDVAEDVAIAQRI